MPMDDPDLSPPPRAVQPVTQTSVGQLLDAGESRPRGADEDVQRVLNETDVYIKYKLYTKAIEHVQRVFELDPRHVEAREKLKALYLTVGKKEEAVLELWALADQAEEGRQRRYLREILELDPADARAADLLGGEAPADEEPRPCAGRRRPDRGAGRRGFCGGRSVADSPAARRRSDSGGGGADGRLVRAR